MPNFEADIYYSGYITVSVKAPDESQALEAAREEAARRHNKQMAEWTEEIIGTLEPWREADTVRLTE